MQARIIPIPPAREGMMRVKPIPPAREGQARARPIPPAGKLLPPLARGKLKP